jgi:hypothetical protein
MSGKTKLELTWIGKNDRPRLEPRILLKDPEKSYHAVQRVGHSGDTTGIPAFRGHQTQLWGIPFEPGFCLLRILPSNARTGIAPVSRWRPELRVHRRVLDQSHLNWHRVVLKA